jgi:hypothetical protein
MFPVLIESDLLKANHDDLFNRRHNLKEEHFSVWQLLQRDGLGQSQLA